MTTTELEELAHRAMTEVVTSMAGADAVPREDQLAAVRALVAQSNRVLVVQATGWGKSAVYWAATKALRSLGRGTTIVVSPLLALMRDQVKAAEIAGLSAVTINSTNVEEWNNTMTRVSAGQVDVLLVSPERLGNATFAQRMAPVLESAGLIVIDEAHCISDWGFDFRPDYQRLARVLASAPDTPVLATTATANQRVSDDVAAQLGDRTVVFRGSLARSSLSLAVVPGLSALERYAWVDQALSMFAGSGIIYVPTVAESTRLAGYLASQGHHVAPYSGQLDSGEREAIEGQLKRNELKAAVATSALGMGYDKPDLSFCIHVGSPSSPVAYYQQIGRAGRAIESAMAVLLPAETDERLWEYFATASMPDPDAILAVLAALDESSPLTLAALEMVTKLRRGRLEALLRVLLVDGAVTKDGPRWELGAASYIHDHAKWAALKVVRAREADLMRQFASGSGCLMEFLQLALDDPNPSACGSCSVCTGHLPGPGLDVDMERVRAAEVFLRGEEVVIEPRKLWPSGLDSERKGSILGCDAGRALCFADSAGWATAARAVGGPDNPLTDEIVTGLVDVLSRWKLAWRERPVAVVAMPSRRHGVMIADLASRVAAVGKLEIIDALQVRGARPPDDMASGPRVAALVETLHLRDGVSLPLGPVLLIDDIYRTGWTMTVAANLLRDAGVSAVLPLVVHQRP